MIIVLFLCCCWGFLIGGCGCGGGGGFAETTAIHFFQILFLFIIHFTTLFIMKY